MAVCEVEHVNSEQWPLDSDIDRVGFLCNASDPNDSRWLRSDCDSRRADRIKSEEFGGFGFGAHSQVNVNKRSNDECVTRTERTVRDWSVAIGFAWMQMAER
jgi:hypothetical protein